MKKVLIYLVAIVAMISMTMFVGIGCKTTTEAEEVAEETTEEVAEETTEEVAEDLEIVFVHKLLGIPWIVRETEGVKAAAKDLGIKADLVAPATPNDVSEQVNLTEDLIARGVDGIIVCPVDVTAIAPALQKATDNGIITISHESPDQEGAMWDIEAFDNWAYGMTLMDQLVKYMGTEGGYVNFVGDLTSIVEVIQAEAATERAKEKYPDVKELTDMIPSHGDMETAYQKTLELIKTYGDELTGIIGSNAVDPPGAAKAVGEKGLSDQIAVGGTTIVSMCETYLNDGSMKWGQAWDPYDLGYACVWAAWWLATGNEFEDGMEIPHLGKIMIDDKNIYGDVAIYFTKENMADYQF